jgi:hypothetical protein
VGLEDETMSLIHLRPIQLEVFGRSFTRKMVPTVGEQYSADIYKQRRYWKRFFFTFSRSARSIFEERVSLVALSCVLDTVSS